MFLINVVSPLRIPSSSLAGDSPGYSFPLVGSSMTPEPGLNPSAEDSAVAEAYSYANPWTKDREVERSASDIFMVYPLYMFIFIGEFHYT